MNFLIGLILAYLFCIICKDSLKKHAVIYYVVTAMISLFVIYGTAPDNLLGNLFSHQFKYGTFGTALITMVMYANAVPNGHRFMKSIMPIRGEASIISCILIFAHNIAFGQRYLLWFFTDMSQFAGNTTRILATGLTVVMIGMLIPLFVTSFKCVRKKMEAKKWKRLQRMAYPFYMLIYYHVMLLMLPKAFEGSKEYIINVFLYSVVFNGYAVMRITKAYAKSNDVLLQLLLVIVLLCNTSVIVRSTPTVAAKFDNAAEEVVEEIQEHDQSEVLDLSETDEMESYIDEFVGEEESWEFEEMWTDEENWSNEVIWVPEEDNWDATEEFISVEEN